MGKLALDSYLSLRFQFAHGWLGCMLVGCGEKSRFLSGTVLE
jgi:hypothetical protein